MRHIRMAIRTLVEFIYREGDIDSSTSSGVTPQEGQRIHQMLQSKYVGFQKEVALKYEKAMTDDITLVLSGRMDGLKDDETGIVIDEIKSVFDSLDHIDEDHSFLHWAQAMLYGAIYLEKVDATEVTIQLTYYSLRSETTKVLTKVLERETLAAFMADTLDRYRRWVLQEAKMLSTAETTSEAMTFPYPAFRAGQDVLAKACYACVRDGHHLIAEAPTGIGKTLSTLFPSVKALGKGLTERIFYLTSKTLHRRVALDAMAQLADNGLEALVVGLQAKEKMCINDLFKCTPEHCPYAKGHFDRVNDVLFELIEAGGIYDPDRIREAATQGVVCPFELALDLTDFAQVVIGDYNYFLDPFVQLKRHFMEPSSAVVLIDEAHNLYERAREMYTGVLRVETVNAAIEDAKALDKTYAKKLRQYRKLLKEQLEGDGDAALGLPLLNAMSQIMLYFSDEGRFSDIQKSDACTNHFFELHRMSRIMEYQDDHFAILIDEDTGGLMLRCLDPSKLLKNSYGLVRSVVCFSATLSPFTFYQSVLGHHESKRLQVGSPFDVSHRILGLNAQHSTYQRDREATLSAIAADIVGFVHSHTGNYFVFCPSYLYLEQLGKALEPLLPMETLVLQAQQMTERDREDFLEGFAPSPEKSRVGLVVLGGAFSEGIDLRGDRLTGVVVVGVGMPTITRERQLMKAFYDAQGENGFDFAYTYPGLNKVFQAGGRLIRTESDRGVLMLICKRFGEQRMLREFPRHWHPYQLIRNPQSYTQFLTEVEMFLNDQ